MPTFSWPADPAHIQQEIIFRTLTTQFESGREQRRSKGSPRRRWRLRFRKDQVDADAIWSFYVDRKGAYEAFLWANPLDNETYTVRFEDDLLSQTVLWKRVYESGISLIEVI